MTSPLLYSCAFLTAVAGTVATMPWWRKWCQKYGVMDDPGHRKIHAVPVPLAGGLAVMSGIVVALAVGSTFAFLQSSTGSMEPYQYGIGKRLPQLIGITVGAIGMLWIGLRDDRVELRPLAKFSAQLVAALAVAACGVRITLFVHNIIFSYAMTVFWILTMVNAMNFMDNMNGLCGGLGIIASLWFGFIAAQAGQYLVAMIGFVIAGALAGFLPFNYPRGRVFLGDAGSHLVGYLLAILGILPHFYTIKHQRALAVLTPLLVLAVPLGDLVWVVLLRTKMRKPFYIGDTNHLSHRLERRGLSRPQAVAIIWMLAAGSGALAYLWQ